MNPPPIDLARSEAAVAPSRDALAWRWSALHEAAGAVAELAGLAAEKPSERILDFPSLITEAGGWRLELAAEGIADLTAMMRPGLTALLAVAARDQDATPAALTLWREFHHARAGVLSLLSERD